MIESDKKKSLKNEAKSIKPAIIIGKEGLKDNSINQIILYIKANKLCKVKIIKAFIDSQELSKKELAKHLAKLTDSELIDQIGNVVVLWKK